MRAAELVGKSGLVVAIEAVDENIQILKKNVEANSSLNIKIVPKAAWKEAGTLKFFRISHQQATAIHQSSKKREEIVVPCDTVDNILKSLKIKRPDFVRLQVNRAEIEVLKGMPKTLSQFPKLLIAAIYKISGEKSWKKTESLLRNKGYETLNECGNVFAWKASQTE
jgi:FkbM family methyltransferase